MGTNRRQDFNVEQWQWDFLTVLSSGSGAECALGDTSNEWDSRFSSVGHGW